MNRPLILAVDFDGTCVTPEFPLIGKNIGAAPVLRFLHFHGVKLILYSLRGNIRRHYNGYPINEVPLIEALNWSEANDVTWDSINEPLLSQTWTDSHKIFADFYLDDMSLNAPLVTIGNYKVYDWVYVLNFFVNYLDLKVSLEELHAIRSQIYNERNLLV